MTGTERGICFFSFLQNEKNQIMTSNVWLQLVSGSRIWELHRKVPRAGPLAGVDRLPAQVGRGGLRGHLGAAAATGQGVEAGHRPV